MKKILFLVCLSLGVVFSAGSAGASRGPRNDQEVDVIAQPRSSGCSYPGVTGSLGGGDSARGYYKIWGSRGFNIDNVTGQNCAGTYLRSWLTGSVSLNGLYNRNSQIHVSQGQDIADVFLASSAFSRYGNSRGVTFTNVQPSENKINGIVTSDVLSISGGVKTYHISGNSLVKGFNDGLASVPAKLRLNDYRHNWSSTVGNKEVTLSTLTCNRFDRRQENFNSIHAHENARHVGPNYYPYLDATHGYPASSSGRCDDFLTSFTIVVHPDPNETNRDDAVNDTNPVTQIIIGDDSSNPSSDDSRWRNIGVQNARVGQKVFFKHQTTANIFRNERSSISGGWRVVQDKSGGLSNISSRSGVAFGSSIDGVAFRHGTISSGQVNANNAESAYVVKNEDVGKTICRRVVVNFKHEQQRKKYFIIPSSGETDHVFEEADDAYIVKESTPACFYVPYEYELKPCVDATQGTSEIKCGGDIVAEPSEKLNIIPRISGSGTPIKPGTQYVITTWEVPASSETTQTPLSESTEWSNNPCSIYANMFSQQAQKCLKSDSGSIVSTNQTFNNPLPEMPENAEFGRRYCVGLSIAPYRMLKDEGKSAQDLRQEWRHSAPVCAKAVKKPKMRVWNNGIYSQAGISMSKSNFKGSVFGSWVEYEAISNGRIAGLTTEGSHGTNNLTFSNAHTELGNFGSPSVSDNDRIKAAIESRFPRNSKDEGYLARDRVQNISNGDILRVRLLDSNETRIIYGGDITISGDQENSRIGQQTVIIANKIYIKPSVKRIDALLIADKVVTCANGASDDASYVSISNCDTPLTINGAVLTKDLKSYRTFGDHRNGEPAEIYNFRPDIYFWAKKFQSSAVIRTTYTKELPVRY